MLRAKVVCGAANNQLAHPGVEKMLADRGILYAPDYVVNAGGVIQVADEIEGFVLRAGQARATRIFDTTREIFAELAEPRACRRRSPPTGWPSGGWPRSAGCAGSWSLAGPADASPAVEPLANVPRSGRLRRTDLRQLR